MDLLSPSHVQDLRTYLVTFGRYSIPRRTTNCGNKICHSTENLGILSPSHLYKAADDKKVTDDVQQYQSQDIVFELPLAWVKSWLRDGRQQDYSAD